MELVAAVVGANKTRLDIDTLAGILRRTLLDDKWPNGKFSIEQRYNPTTMNTTFTLYCFKDGVNIPLQTATASDDVIEEYKEGILRDLMKLAPEAHAVCMLLYGDPRP